MKTTLRGDFVACSIWLLPDGTVRAVKFAQADHDAWHAERDAQGDPHDAPGAGAIHLQTFGGIPAVDTADGFPEPGMWWVWTSPAGQRVLVIQRGDFPIGNWHYHSTELGAEISVRGHRVVVPDYDGSDPATLTLPDEAPSATVTPFERPA